MYMISTKIEELLKQLLFSNAPRISKPVFILSAPRSGSTHLYEILRRCNSVISLNQENDAFWWSMFPYSRLDLPNDYISATEIDMEFSLRIREALSLHVIHKLYNRNFSEFLKFRFSGRKPAYLEKTVANCFHLDALAKLFPEAKFIHLVRDGRATISSMIEGWRSGRFMKKLLPFPDNSSIDYWTYPVPPGWENMVHAKLNEICAWSWLQHNNYVLEFFERNPALRKDLFRISYEELIEKPDAKIDSLIRFCDFNKSSSVASYLQANQSSRTTISEPDPMKWKSTNVDEILEIEDSIAPMMSRLGYPDGHALTGSSKQETA